MRRAAILWAGLACALAGQAQAQAQEQRVCEGVMRGPAGEHIVQYLLEDGTPVAGLAIWRPPNQTAVRGRALPMMALYYRVTDLETGARSPLMHVHVIHAAFTGRSSASSATVGIRRYGEADWLERREWAYFATAREADRDDVYSMAASVGFGSPAALELFSTAPQVQSNVVTDQSEEISSGIWNLTYRVALDPLLDRAHQEARRRVSSPSECRRPTAEHSPLLGMTR